MPDIKYTLHLIRKGTKQRCAINVISDRELTAKAVQDLIIKPRDWMELRRALFSEFGWLKDNEGVQWGIVLPVTITFTRTLVDSTHNHCDHLSEESEWKATPADITK